MEDRRLVEACLAREPGAWEEFVRRMSGVVLHVARAIVGDDAEGVAQEVFTAIVADDLKLLRQYNPEFALSTWVGIIARTNAAEAPANE